MLGSPVVGAAASGSGAAGDFSAGPKKGWKLRLACSGDDRGFCGWGSGVQEVGGQVAEALEARPAPCSVLPSPCSLAWPACHRARLVGRGARLPEGWRCLADFYAANPEAGRGQRASPWAPPLHEQGTARLQRAGGSTPAIRSQWPWQAPRLLQRSLKGAGCCAWNQGVQRSHQSAGRTGNRRSRAAAAP